jgi:hypothetical protein
MSNRRIPEPFVLAAAFSRRLREEIPANIDEVIPRNRAEADPNVCHSHDFCDANIVMHDACMALGYDALHPAAENDTLWNDAWDIAKRNNFTDTDRVAA